RVRKALSYEAIAVDLLRLLRGPNAVAAPNTLLLKQLSMHGPRAAPLSVLAVRLNNSAVFLYACTWVSAAESPQGKEKFIELGAWLLCQKQECAPLSQPELGQMVGYTGFVSAQLAAAMANYLLTTNPLPESITEDVSSRLLKEVFAGVRRSLGWQRVCYERGCLHMLFKNKKESWEPTSAAVKEDQTGY